MKNSRDYGVGALPLSGWHRYLLLLALVTFCFPLLAFAQAPNILIGPSAVDFGSIGKGGNSTQTALVVNYNPPPATIATGLNHSCAVTSTGGVKCWGFDDQGQLGNGATTGYQYTPTDVVGITNAVAVTAAQYHSCALLSTGGIKCWGLDDQGQLGNGATIGYQYAPTDVVGITDAVAVSAGLYHTCAVTRSGGVKCWGMDDQGQLGNGSVTTGYQYAPVDVPGLTDVVDIAASQNHTCAVTRSGGVKCWGMDDQGQLGNGATLGYQYSPTDVVGITDAVAVSAGFYNSCAITRSGGVKCWGLDDQGQLGNGATLGYQYSPTDVVGITDAADITSSQYHTCVITRSGATKCWGLDDQGQLGNGATTTGYQFSPVDVPGAADAVAISSAYYNTCVVTRTGGIKCWGYDNVGQLGNGATTTDTRYAPVDTTISSVMQPPVVDPLVLDGAPPVTITGANASSFAITGSTCTDALTLNANEICTVDMRFSDTVFGKKSASLNVTSNDPDDKPATAPLSGEVSTAPGGVSSGLGLWLKANAGTSTTTDGADVATWADSSPTKNDVSQALVARQPNYVANGMNFNPALDFAGGQALSNTTGNKTLPNETDPVTMLAVSTNKTSGDWRGLINFSGPTNYPFLAWYYNKPNLYIDGTGSVHNLFDTDVDASTIPVAMCARTNNANPQNSRLGYNGLANQKSFTSADGQFPASSINNLLTIGAETDAAGYPLNGLYPEAVVYNRDLSDAEMTRINSYLGIKYGITMSENYLAADGTTKIWDKAANNTYHNDVAGIGRDDASALVQKQSKSVDAGFQPTIGLGDIAATNAANTNTFAADISYMVWGNNGASASFGTAYAPNSYAPAAGYYRMARVWKVQETGTVGTVKVQAAGAKHLLVSSDPTFATGVTEIAAVDGVATVDFTDGQYFTFGTEITAPGHVASGLNVWLRADMGTSTTTDGAKLTQWDDQSGNGRNHTQATAALQPTFKANGGFNFNPAVTFDGSDIMRTTAYASGNEAIHVFAMSKVADSGWRSLYGVSADSTHVQWLNNLPSAYLFGNRDYNGVAQTPGQGITSFLLPKDASQQTMRWNGISSNTTLAAGTKNYTYNANTFGIGSDDNQVATSQEMLGDIQEMIVYKSGTPTTNGGLMDATDVQKIETYLGIKYGVTLANNYLDGTGATLYDISTYPNNIAGIGRDDAEALNQKQSMSVNAGAQLTVSLGAVAASNAANTNTFAADKSYLVWGDNNGALALSANYNGGSNNRLARVWKAQVTGTVGEVKVTIPTTVASGLQSVIINSSNTFAAVDRSVALTTNGSNYEATVSLKNGDYFTFSTNPASVAVACGDGVIGAGEKCDDGNATAGDGCSLSCAVESGFKCKVDINADGICDTAGAGSLVVVAGATDTDGDGIPDSTDTDDDNDGVSDATEIALGTDPLDADSDNTNTSPTNEGTDGIQTGKSISDDSTTDTDSDGKMDAAECEPLVSGACKDTDKDGVPDWKESATADADHDGVPDELDAENTNPNNDSDGDGLSNITEKTLGTDPMKTDTDADGKPDGAEVGADPAHPTDTDADGKIDALESIKLDADNDSVPNELDADDLDPNNDSDGDGVGNAAEKAAGTDPLDKTSYPNTAPSFTTANNVTFAENGTGTVLDVDATDSAGDTVTYAFDNSALTDNSLFKIDSASGVLTFKATPDYEAPKDSNKDNTHIVMLKACDSKTACTTQVLIIAVTSVSEPVLEYSIRRDAGSNRYRVYMRPKATPATNLSMTGQVTLKVPHGTGTSRFAVSDLKSAVGGILWTLDSRSDAPSEGSSADYLSFTFSPTGSSAFAWKAGQEMEVFNFTNNSVCSGNVGVMDNADTFNTLPNSRSTNPGNQFNNVGWGPAGENHYLGNYGTPQDCTSANNIKLQVRAFLQGAYSSADGMMHDKLGAAGLIPSSQPYNAAPWLYAGAETLSVTVQAMTGKDAITDWVLVELRDATLPKTVVATQAAVLQRDGDIVDATTGASTLTFNAISAGNYYVSVRHRNHLGVMSKSALALASDTTRLVDFTLPATDVYGSYARLDGATTSLLWAGDANSSNAIIANGGGNDVNLILGTVLAQLPNTDANVNYRLNGYYATDVNLDGVTLYAGPNNDINPLLGNVLLHPSNASFAANYIVNGGVPK
jgi:cysteine-rich repeat protein